MRHQVPSVLGIDAKEARRRWRKALVLEYVSMVTEPIKKNAPEVADGLMGVITVAGMAAAIMAIMVAIA